MAEHLVFTLCAALGAMGELAGHERRGSLTWPGRSAVIGLVAAAMGIRRGNDDAFARLDALRMAVGVIDDGVPLRDYHTVETIPTAAARKPDSRPAAIARAGRNTNTTITLRRGRGLRQPAFTLYLGRKSCPLAAPPAPRIVRAEGPLQALSLAVRPPFGHQGALRLIASDERLSQDDVQDSRNDLPVERAKWHFGQRTVFLHRPAEAV